MRSLEEILPASQFFRIQKSYIVSLDKIDSIERQRIFIGNKVIPIGETYASQFFSLIGKV
jgi:DNA-binding LytR/AlgR family response regulator